MHGSMEPRTEATRQRPSWRKVECVVAGGHGKSKMKHTNSIVKMDRLPDPHMDARFDVMLRFLVGGSPCVRQLLALSRHFDQRRPKQILLLQQLERNRTSLTNSFQLYSSKLDLCIFSQLTSSLILLQSSLICSCSQLPIRRCRQIL
jgi:hypothetical protein